MFGLTAARFMGRCTLGLGGRGERKGMRIEWGTGYCILHEKRRSREEIACRDPNAWNLKLPLLFSRKSSTRTLPLME